MPRRRTPWYLLLVALAGGCPSDCDTSSYPTTSGRWLLMTDELVADPLDLPGQQGKQQDEPLLVGTRWCPAFHMCEGDKCGESPADLVADCFSPRVEGPGQADGLCLEVTGGGALVWRFDPSPCEHPGLFFPEELRLQAVAADQVRGRLGSYLDALALDYLSPETGSSFPPGLVRPADAPVLKLAADQPVHLAVNLWAGERRVAWSPEQASLEVEVLRGAAPIAALDVRATIAVQAPAGSEAALFLVVGASRVALGQIRGVPSAAFRALEAVVAYDANFGEVAGSRIPSGVRAVVRDDEGDLVYGAAAEWEVLAGSFPLMPADLIAEGKNLDYIMLNDGSVEDGESTWCFPTPNNGTRSFTGRIAARVGDLRAEVDLAWTYRASRDRDGPFKSLRPGANCQGPGFPEIGACACTGAPPQAPPLALLAVLALATTRRRRPCG